MTTDEVQQRREEVERAREELARSVDELSGRALDTPNQIAAKLRERAVPIAIGVASVVVLNTLRRRRRRRPLLEAGPFVLLERR